MSSSTHRQRVSLYLLVGVLLFVASGALAAAPHDHDPNEFCRVCSVAGPYSVTVDEHGTETPGLEASAEPILLARADARACLLAAIPLRGPPSTS